MEIDLTAAHNREQVTSSVSYSVHQVNGLEMGVLLDGDPAPLTLVLLHGFTGSALNWVPLLTDLRMPGWRIMALDMLGHGISSKPVDPARYQMEHCANDILTILQQLSIPPEQTILLGYSMGARIALYTTLQQKKFPGLILESGFAGFIDQQERDARIAQDEELARRIELDGIEAFVDFWESIPLFATQQHLPVNVRQQARRQRMQNDPLGLANSLRGAGKGSQPALQCELPTYHHPVCLMTGEADPKFTRFAQEMVQQFPVAKLHIIPKAGHNIHLEAREMFTTIVREFCQNCPTT